MKLEFCREGIVDDFDTDQKPLCSPTLRSYSGGNTITGHGKNEKGRNMKTDFLIRMIVNSFPRFRPALIGPDARRMAIIYYPCTFKPPATYDESNPNHRQLKNFKDQVDDFAAYFVDWCRLLASSTKAGGIKNLWPQPAGMQALIQSLMQDENAGGDSVADVVKKFITKHLRKCEIGEIPDSRDAIIKKCVAESKQTLEYRTAQQELRNQLVWSEKPYLTRKDGSVVKVLVFTFAQGLKLENCAKIVAGPNPLVALVAPRVLRGFAWLQGWLRGWLHWLHPVFCRVLPGCRVFLLGFWGGCTKKAVKHEGKHTAQPAQPVQPGVLGQIPGQETLPDQKLAEVGGGRGWLQVVAGVVAPTRP